MDFKLRGTQFFNKLHFKGGDAAAATRSSCVHAASYLVIEQHDEKDSTLSEHLGPKKIAAPHVHTRPRTRNPGSVSRPLQSPSTFWTNSILGMEREGDGRELGREDPTSDSSE